MRNEPFRISLLLTFMALAASCITVVDPEQAGSWPPGGEFRKTVDFEAGGTVTVEHTLGNIVITGWDNNSVEVVATGRAGEQGTNRRVGVYSMDDLEPSIDVRLSGGALRIRTRSLGGPWASGGLDYAIRVPSSVNLKGITLDRGDVTISDVYGQVGAAISKGDLTVKNFSGGLKATLEAGQADIELLDIREDDLVEVTSQEGDITLRLEPGANARIEAESKGGEITGDYDLGLMLPAKSVTAQLGSGAARITLQALRGSIKILKTE
jgi:DUF4097 and DUF4098 domain-containing protein YvlB